MRRRDPNDAENGVASVRAADRTGLVEREMLRPLLRGEGVTPWGACASAESIIWTHDNRGAPLAALPPLTARWLARWRRRLAARTDARAGAAWWTLFRTPAAVRRDARVVWADMGRAPRALLLPAGDPTVPLNSCYVVPCDDATTRSRSPRCSTPHSPLRGCTCSPSRRAAATIATSAGRWRSSRCRAIGAARARCSRRSPSVRSSGEPPTACELLDVTTRAYRLRAADVAPLVAWAAR